MTGGKRLWWGSSSFGVVRPEAKGELVAVLPLYDDSPVKDGWFYPLSRLVHGVDNRLTSRDMVDMINGVSTVDVWTGGGDTETGPVQTSIG